MDFSPTQSGSNLEKIINDGKCSDAFPTPKIPPKASIALSEII